MVANYKILNTCDMTDTVQLHLMIGANKEMLGAYECQNTRSQFQMSGRQ